MSLTFPASAVKAGSTNNNILNLEVTSLTIGGAYTLTGNAVYMGDSATAPTVTASASSTISLPENLRHSTTFSVSSGDTLVVSQSGTIIDPTISTPGTVITLNGGGALDLAASSSSFVGATAINSGTLELSDPSALGDQTHASTNALSVASGAVLELGPSTTSPFAVAQQINLSGTLLGKDTNDHVSGLINLGGDGSAGGAIASDGRLYVDGQIAGAGGAAGVGPLTVNYGHAGTVVLDSTTNNNYSGNTTVTEGTLSLDVIPASGTGLATPNMTTADSGATIALAAPGQLDPNNDLQLNGGSALDLAGQLTSVRNLVLNSTSSTVSPTAEDTKGGGTLTAATITSQGSGLPAVISAGLAPSGVQVATTNSLVISGPLSGSGNLTLNTSGSPNFCSSGTSTATCVALLISGNSTGYTGTLTATNGVLDVTGNLPSAAVTSSGGTLTGTGTVGAVTVGSGGILAPGTTVTASASRNFTDADAPGKLTVSSLTFGSGGATFNVRVDGTSPGNGSTTCSGYDQVGVTGSSVNLGSAANIVIYSDKASNGTACLVPSPSQSYTAISAPAATNSSTFFANAPTSGSDVSNANTSPYTFSVTYHEGSPPADVVLGSVINDAVQIAAAPSGNPTYGQQVVLTVTVSALPPATGTPTGTVAFTDNVTPTGSQSSSPVSITCQGSTNNSVTLSAGIGRCTPTSALPGGVNVIVATYNGDSTFTRNTQTINEDILQQATMTSLTSGAPNPSNYGQSVTFTATVTPSPAAGTQAATVVPTGTVTFYQGGAALSDCSNLPVTASAPITATCQTTNLNGGTDTVTAAYSGDGNYRTSSSSGVSQTVNPDSTTTTLSPGSVNPSVYGQSVSFTATVNPASTGPEAPGGQVVFENGTSTIPGCAAVTVSANTAVCTTTSLPVGTDSITATYTGDGNYSGSPSNAVSQTVNQAATTTRLSSSPADPSAAGQQVTYTATISVSSPGAGTPGGTVSFADGGITIPNCGSRPVGTNNGTTTATCAVTYTTPGSHSITAAYSGDTDFAASNAGAYPQSVTQGVTTTNLSPGTPNPSMVGQQVTFTATVTPNPIGSLSPTGTVSFYANGARLPDCSSVSLTPSGGMSTATCNTTSLPVTTSTANVVMTASYSGDGNFNPSSSGPVNQTVKSSPDAVGADPYVAAFQANGGNLWTVGTSGWKNWNVGIAADTNPSVFSLPNGGYEIAFQAAGGSLWTVGTAGWVNWGVGVAPRTSPVGVALPNGGYEIAFQAEGGALWSVGTAGWVNWGVGVAPGTSPAVTPLPNGGYEIAFQAAGGALWSVGTAGWVNWGVGMAPGTNPAVTSLPNGGYEIAFQAAGGALWSVGTGGWVNWGVGMAPGTSPGVTSLPNGGYEIAFQANDQTLWTIGEAGWDSWGLGMAPGTSPSITRSGAGGLIVGYQGYNGNLWTVGSQGYDWSLGLAPGTSPSLL